MTHEPATNAAQLAVDPISAASPDMSDADFKALVESIKTQGQLVPIVVHDGQVIDGRKRLAACRVLGVEPDTIKIDDTADAMMTATALNILRTHYSTSERAMFAAKLSGLSRAEANRIRKGSSPNSGMTIPPTDEEAARMMGVGLESVRVAKRLRREASPEVVKAVERGNLTVNAAEKIIATTPRDEQPETVRKVAAAKRGNRNMMASALGLPTAPRKLPQRPPTEVLTRLFRQMADGLLVLGMHDQAPLPDDETRREWIRSITDVMHALRKYKRRLEEERWQR